MAGESEDTSGKVDFGFDKLTSLIGNEWASVNDVGWQARMTISCPLILRLIYL